MTISLPRILVIDDEQHQLDTVCRGLFLHGYCCETAQSVEAALNRLSKDETFDLVLTDLTMPRRSGLELINTLRSGWPDLPIVVITGLSVGQEVESIRDMGIPLLKKPFGPETLNVFVRKALGLPEPDPTKDR